MRLALSLVIAAAIAAFPAMTTPAAVAGGKAQPVPLSWPWYLLLVVLQMFGSISSNLMWVPQVRLLAGRVLWAQRAVAICQAFTFTCTARSAAFSRKSPGWISV